MTDGQTNGRTDTLSYKDAGTVPEDQRYLGTRPDTRNPMRPTGSRSLNVRHLLTDGRTVRDFTLEPLLLLLDILVLFVFLLLLLILLLILLLLFPHNLLLIFFLHR